MFSRYQPYLWRWHGKAGQGDRQGAVSSQGCDCSVPVPPLWCWLWASWYQLGHWFGKLLASTFICHVHDLHQWWDFACQDSGFHWVVMIALLFSSRAFVLKQQVAQLRQCNQEASRLYLSTSASPDLQIRVTVSLTHNSLILSTVPAACFVCRKF